MGRRLVDLLADADGCCGGQISHKGVDSVETQEMAGQPVAEMSLKDISGLIERISLGEFDSPGARIQLDQILCRLGELSADSKYKGHFYEILNLHIRAANLLEMSRES